MRVLVVEDETTLSSAIRMGLEAEAFAVDVAHDGDEGLRHAVRNLLENALRHARSTVAGSRSTSTGRSPPSYSEADDDDDD